MRAALDRYRGIIDAFPESPEARYARIHIRSLSQDGEPDAEAVRAARLPALDNEAAGDWLRRRVVNEGRFVAVRIPNVYDTVRTLASFFRGQSHEWAAVCLLDYALVCHLIWVNGGGREGVGIRFGMETFVQRVSPYVGARSIIVAHNHPVPPAESGRRRRRLRARVTHTDLEQLSAFSELDRTGSEAWRSYCRSNGIGYAEVLYAGHNILIGGDQALVDDWRAHRRRPGWPLLSMLACVFAPRIAEP